MPKIWPILAQGFTNVFTRLGIQAVPAGNQWFLSDTLIPVSLVDSDITLNALVQRPVQVWVSEGVKVAPANNIILADTGQLPTGTRTFVFLLHAQNNQLSSQWALEHRDAANAATLNSMVFGQDAGGNEGAVDFICEFTIAIAQDERLRVRQVVTATAASTIQASIFHNPA